MSLFVLQWRQHKALHNPFGITLFQEMDLVYQLRDAYLHSFH